MEDLPDFTAEGLLPAGDYQLSIGELRSSLLVQGGHFGCQPSWDHAWRHQLVDNLAILADQLRRCGVEEIFVNGSFVEDKDHPNDIDGYFECDFHRLISGELEQELNLLDPHKIWTWDPAYRRPYRGYPKRQLPMWHAYRVELYPHHGQFSGIRDQYGNELEFPAAFRVSRQHNRPKGIVKLV